MNLWLSPSSLLQVNILRNILQAEINPRPAGMRSSNPGFFRFLTSCLGGKRPLAYPRLIHSSNIRFWCKISQSKSVGSSTRARSQQRKANDFRRTKHCWQNYVDYHKCIIAKGEEFAPCRQVLHLPSNQVYYLPSSLIIDASFTWRTGLYVRVLGAHDGTINGVLASVSSPPIYTH